MSLIEKHLFEKRGGCGCKESDYNLLRTTCCKTFIVEDDELLDYYFDPNDLKKTVHFSKGEPCPFCGNKNWSYEDIDDFSLMPESWRWAAPSDLRNKI